MFAVIRTGGKQYRVGPEDVILVERLTAEPGAFIAISDILMLGGDGTETVVGAPTVANAAVFAEVLDQTRGDKILMLKKRRRKNYRRRGGHRQHLTVLRIAGISPDGTRPADLEAKAKAKPKAAPAAEGDADPKAKRAKPAKSAKAAAAPKAKKPAAKAKAPAPKRAKSSAKAPKSAKAKE